MCPRKRFSTHRSDFPLCSSPIFSVRPLRIGQQELMICSRLASEARLLPGFIGKLGALTYRGVHQPLDPHGDPVDGACQAKPEIRNIDRSAIWMGCGGIRTFCTAGSSEKSLASSSYCSPGVTVSRSRHVLDRIYSTSMSRLHDSQNPRPESGQLASGSPRDSPTRLPRTAL